MRRWARSLEPATESESERISTAAVALLRQHGWTKVLTFLSMPGEVDLSNLHNQAGFEFHVTRTPAQGPLTVHRLTDDLEQHPFGYLQPGREAPLAEVSTLEVVLVPGVLFDRQGGRLGHGKGYYDQLLASSQPQPYLVGVTLERRVVDRVPIDTTDVIMDGLLTEEGFNPRSNR